MILYASANPVVAGTEISVIQTLSKEAFRVRVGSIAKPDPASYVGAVFTPAYDQMTSHEETADGAFNLMIANQTLPATEVLQGTSDYNGLYSIIAPLQ